MCSKKTKMNSKVDKEIRAMTLEKAFAEYLKNDENQSVCCDICGDTITIAVIGESAYSVKCKCGRYNSTMKGF